jgi:hypothetical protein
VAFLVSRTDYKSWRGITGTADDTFIDLILGWVSNDIRDYCSRDGTNGFESATRTEYYSGPDDAIIQLRERPVTSITSVTQTYAGGQSVVLDSSTYRVDADSGLLSRIDVARNRFASYNATYLGQGGDFKPSPRFEEGFNNFTVVYVAGYATIPGALQKACCLLADMLFNGRGRDMAVQSETIGQYSYTLADQKRVDDIRISLLRGYVTGGA